MKHFETTPNLTTRESDYSSRIVLPYYYRWVIVLHVLFVASIFNIEQYITCKFHVSSVIYREFCYVLDRFAATSLKLPCFPTRPFCFTLCTVVE